MEINEKNNMIFGVHPVLELIRSQKEIEKVFIQLVHVRWRSQK